MNIIYFHLQQVFTVLCVLKLASHWKHLALEIAQLFSWVRGTNFTLLMQFSAGLKEIKPQWQIVDECTKKLQTFFLSKVVQFFGKNFWGKKIDFEIKRRKFRFLLKVLWVSVSVGFGTKVFSATTKKNLTFSLPLKHQEEVLKDQCCQAFPYPVSTFSKFTQR